MMYGDGWMWGWGGWALMSIMMVLVWALVIAGIVLAIRFLGGPRQSAGRSHGYPKSSAEDLLAERFARGEIDEDEYRRRAALLREHR
ncbi:SHOCT domain-containing protein [Mycolicibacterium psychrotolerans]|uniref:Membrane protein n=1 Tax=Mycolicibacterium psychrotolerans TaxID=216929 RepID=A0A7I7MIN3_9MYCO|nr:SHOCT domain-containing protein [Mycolicibacterium psychrotolerans]BBX71393.1 membrane protein [Mycolicibacterium psychrotolerans]